MYKILNILNHFNVSLIKNTLIVYSILGIFINFSPNNNKAYGLRVPIDARDALYEEEITQVRAFGRDFISKLEDIGADLYVLSKYKTGDVISDTGFELKDNMRLLNKILDDFGKNQLALFSEEIRIPVSRLFEIELQNMQQILIPADFSAEDINTMAEAYNRLYPLVLKLSHMDRIPVIDKQDDYEEFCRLCSDFEPDEALDRVIIAIVTFDHGPATDPFNLYFRSIIKKCEECWDLINFFERTNSKATISTEAVQILSDGLTDIHGVFRDRKNGIEVKFKKLMEEAYLYIRKKEKPDFVCMSGWKKELEYLCEYIETDLIIKIEEVKKQWRYELDKMNAVVSLKYAEKWQVLMDSMRNVLDVVENRYRVASGDIKANALNTDELIADSCNASRMKNFSKFNQIKHYTDTIFIEADKISLVNALSNLLNNATYWAYKYQEELGNGDKAEVTLELSKENNNINIIISDNGPGMDENTMKDIFKLGVTGRGENGGSGIGLAETLYAVRQHGGDIKVESESGKGTRFIVTLPRLKGVMEIPAQEIPLHTSL